MHCRIDFIIIVYFFEVKIMIVKVISKFNLNFNRGKLIVCQFEQFNFKCQEIKDDPYKKFR